MRVLSQFYQDGIRLNGRDLDIKLREYSNKQDELCSDSPSQFSLLREAVTRHKLLKGGNDWRSVSVSPSASDLTSRAQMSGSVETYSMSIKPDAIPDSGKDSVLNAAVRPLFSKIFNPIISELETVD